jgi:hypothetical protein
MELLTTRTLATLRENLRLAREVRSSALERGNLDLVAAENETIPALEARIARLEATVQRRATHPPRNPPAR